MKNTINADTIIELAQLITKLKVQRAMFGQQLSQLNPSSDAYACIARYQQQVDEFLEGVQVELQPQQTEQIKDILTAATHAEQVLLAAA
ncbi:hypothetical protein BZJ19_10150 [Salinivibrio proteolyticus]|uniref:hypothetical protein n=1 Tax=Salinivibrio proteolyticus TaxID=334715 RepID=UPI000988EC0D|nr:hypothetical protein [Salinivibrio proteolyticus]OOF25071.1 hypothetical protein BZJ19_10150 [Salinivibrio proteolyticus]